MCCRSFTQQACRISLDDFGTGYSSLSYLHNFPLQKVKIDRSFLEGIDTDRPLTLLRGVARLSADLGMTVVVEGIETNEQLELISADGTDHARPRVICSAAPVPATRIRQLLDASHGRRVIEPGANRRGHARVRPDQPRATLSNFRFHSFRAPNKPKG